MVVQLGPNESAEAIGTCLGRLSFLVAEAGSQQPILVFAFPEKIANFF